MRYEIKSIRLWSFLKVAFFLNIIVGFLSGFFFAFFTAAIISALGNVGGLSPYGFELPQEFPVGFLFVIYPFIGAVTCAIFLTLFEFILIGLYNAIAKITGGVELNLNVVAEEIPAQQPLYAYTQMQTTVPPPPSPVASAPLPAVAPKPPPPVVEPRPESGIIETTQPPVENPAQNQKPPDPEFPTRTVGG